MPIKTFILTQDLSVFLLTAACEWAIVSEKQPPPKPNTLIPDDANYRACLQVNTLSY